jgi:hypothetical protein
VITVTSRRFYANYNTMKITHRKKVVRETERKLTAAVIRQPARFFCITCNMAKEMLSINEAAIRKQTIWSEIVRAIEAGELHFAETAKGEIYVCAASLSENRQIH